MPRVTRMVVPREDVEATLKSPRCDFIRRREIDSPRPVPLPTSLVVTNGSNTRLRISLGIPGPSSDTSMTT